MVRKECPAFVFLGPDTVDSSGSSSKETILKKIKAKYLSKASEDFNFDILYAADLSLKDLQEKLLYLPLNSGVRVTLIKGAQHLDAQAKEFILRYLRKPNTAMVLVIDVDKYSPKDTFVKSLVSSLRPVYTREQKDPDAFLLARQITSSRAHEALKVLDQLLEKGQKPEMILGGLRYAWERDAASALKMRRGLKLLLNCDIEIKTGKLKAHYALEKLVVSLCSLAKPFR